MRPTSGLSTSFIAFIIIVIYLLLFFYWPVPRLLLAFSCGKEEGEEEDEEEFIFPSINDRPSSLLQLTRASGTP